MSTLTIHTDGGARGNPGPAAVGVVMRCGDWEWQHNRTIGSATNNVAEYTAILEAIRHLPELLPLCGPVNKLEFYLDSELVVRQLNGQYKVKEPTLRELYQQVHTLLHGLGIAYAIIHVRREKNKEADALVNHALDHA